MDQTGTNIAVPVIAEHFGADIPTVQWISLGYILSTSALLMPMGRLSDMFGRKLVYSAGFIVFITAAAVGGSSQSLELLIGAKIVQGIGSAAISANGMAMVADAFPDRERGKALGMYMTIIGTGAASGPVIGGFLVSEFGWRSIFFFTVPMGLLALTAAILVLRVQTRNQSGNQSNSFDYAGAIMSSGALIAFLLGLTNAHRLGFSSPLIILSFVISVAMIAGFIYRENHTDYPLLDLSFFRIQSYTFGVTARFLSFVGMSSIFFLMPFYLIQALGFPTNRAGLLMVPGSIGMAIMGPISGRLSDKIGTRWLTVIGMGFLVAALLNFATLGINPPIWRIVLGMALSGSGNGIFGSPNTSSVLSYIKRENYGVVSAFLNLTRTSANVTGVAVATTIVAFTMVSLGHEPNLSNISHSEGGALRQAFGTGMTRAFLVGAMFATAAMLVSAVKRDSSPPKPSDDDESSS